MQNIVNIFLAAVLTALVAQYTGWMAVPLVAVIVSLGGRELRLRAWQAGAGAAFAWGAMLAGSARLPSFSRLLTTVADVFHLPPPLFLALTLALPFVLGWSAATLALALLRSRSI